MKTMCIQLVQQSPLTFCSTRRSLLLVLLALACVQQRASSTSLFSHSHNIISTVTLGSPSTACLHHVTRIVRGGSSTTCLVDLLACFFLMKISSKTGQCCLVVFNPQCLFIENTKQIDKCAREIRSFT